MDIEQIMMIGAFLIAALIIVFAFLYLLRRQSAHANVHLHRVEAISKLLDKVATPDEFAKLLQTEQGRALLEEPARVVRTPYGRVLRLLQAGIVFLFVGPAFLISAFHLSGEIDPNYIREAKEQFFWGSFSFALGLGFLCAAFLTRLFIRKWGLNGHAVKSDQ